MESLALKTIGNGNAVGSSALAEPQLSSFCGGQMVISSPCAGCKLLRRKCQPDCAFAPYFPPDQPQKFVNVHRVFGASNVTKILNELHPFQREDAVNSLAYEAEMRLRDPVYGCVGIISLLQRQLRQLQIDLLRARSELSKYQLPVAGIGMEQLMMRGYAAAAAAECGGGGAYNAGLMTAVEMVQFARPSAAGGDDRHCTLWSL